MATPFIPRKVFPHASNLPRAFFQGHHVAALNDMNMLLSSTDLILELRDYRIPLSSGNPLLEEKLAGLERMIVYTKRDLGSNGGSSSKHEFLRDAQLREWHHPHKVHFIQGASSTSAGERGIRRRATKPILEAVQEFMQRRDALTPVTMMVVGMPNVGKSTLLNALRSQAQGYRAKKAARTGDEPGVTKSISEVVKLLAGETEATTLYVRDTPGVFVPYVQDAETMLKLALCGCVRLSNLPVVTVADYCLFRINLVDPALYAADHAPTNDILEFLHKVARRAGKLKTGGVPDVEATAIWFIQNWRRGLRGRFLLDEVSAESLRLYGESCGKGPVSLSQARKIYFGDMKLAAQKKRLAKSAT